MNVTKSLTVESAEYALQDSIFVPTVPVTHRDDEYDSSGFETLLQMQEKHFWYLGRHRFLLRAIDRHIARLPRRDVPPRIIDLGGACGGSLRYVLENKRFEVSEAALADSSLLALRFAADVLPASVSRYQIDLARLGWHDRWDIALLLDVLEHIPDDAHALRQIRDALSPGGLLFVTTPALESFWTWNDEVALHQRRYSKADFRRLADDCGLELVRSYYFMFILSPLLVLTRMLRRPHLHEMTSDQIHELLERTHRVPAPAVNRLLYAMFACETPLGHFFPFPWGTSVLAVFRKRPC